MESFKITSPYFDITIGMTSDHQDIDNCVEIISKLAYDFEHFCYKESIPVELNYRVMIKAESGNILRSARQAALESMLSKLQIKKTASSNNSPLKKFAFDTRRFDQELTRNPRHNLQNWMRTDQFIDEDMQRQIDIFAKLLRSMEEIKEAYGAQPEWHESYARTLYDHLTRVLRIKQGDLDIFRPQLAYLEQLMFARYRLSMDELAAIDETDFKKSILKKDEALLKRGAFLHMSRVDSQKKQSSLAKDGNQVTQENIVNAIFGNNGFRHNGEKTVERTITITIKDQVIE